MRERRKKSYSLTFIAPPYLSVSIIHCLYMRIYIIIDYTLQKYEKFFAFKVSNINKIFHYTFLLLSGYYISFEAKRNLITDDVRDVFNSFFDASNVFLRLKKLNEFHSQCLINFRKFWRVFDEFGSKSISYRQILQFNGVYI